MKQFILAAAVWAVIALAGAALVVGFGLYNVSARKGHLPGVSWVLHTTYHNSVRLRAPPASDVPDLSSPDLIALGARHYNSACSICHAAPGEQRARTVTAMEPPPPHIREAVGHWEPRHLYWIVLNGVKMTGMPAWPSDKREDEVWAVVAFLARVANMDARQYREMTALADGRGAGEGDRGGRAPARLAYCAACHGRDGAGRGNAFTPRLDLQREPYLIASLEAYRDGRRFSGVMEHAASDLNDDEIAGLASHYGSAEPAAAAEPERDRDGQLIEIGRALAHGAAARAKVPACSACHGPWPTKRSPLFPSLGGQREAYLFTQLRLWKEGRRGGSRLAHLMHKVVTDLDKGQMRALAAYYASLPPKKQDPAGMRSTAAN